jgi:hypothetical protein
MTGILTAPCEMVDSVFRLYCRIAVEGIVYPFGTIISHS